MNLLTKKDKTISLTKTGKVKFKLNDLEAIDLKITIQKGGEIFTNCLNPNKVIGQHNYEYHAGLALLMDLWKAHFTYQDDPITSLNFTLTRHESLLFWGTLGHIQNMGCCGMATTLLMGKLHQKLT